MQTRRILVVGAAALLLLGACSTKKAEKAAEPRPAITIGSPADGTVVKGNVVKLAMTASGIQIVKADGDTTGATGHYHVFVDREPVGSGQVIPKEAGIVHSAASPTLIGGLSIGSHTLTVVVGDGTHKRIGAAVARTTVRVDGPSIDANAPATAAAGQAVTVTVNVAGVTLIKADGAAQGTTGHLHVLVDQDPPAAGQAILNVDGIIHSAAPTIVVPGLTAGEHTLWVVLGDGRHIPYDPPVMDKIVINVS